MKFCTEPDLYWTEHYVKYGFAVVKGLVDRAFISEALEEIKRLVASPLPLTQWTKDHITIPNGSANPVLARVYDQPGVRSAIAEMFGSLDEWNRERQFQLFLKPYDPKAPRELTPSGHIDFVKCPIPVLGSGFMFQVSLVDKQPYGGNITVWPGTHRPVQKCVMQSPAWRYPANWDDIPMGDPFEFVAEAGDTLFFHHLVAHAGNPCCTRMPRISLHCQGLRNEWLPEVDPSRAGMSPWERSLALNGRYRPPQDEKTMMERGFRERREEQAMEAAAAAAATS
ncbi:MAG: hypothetical protein HYU36_13775 [Planctomycetes bacterium]|nr:hypothetical protein [Planctomycetota bacterium]